MRHWLEAEELPRCQYCDCLADECSFMCEDHAGEADMEVQTLRDHLTGAVEALHEAIRLARNFNRGAMTWMEYDRKLTVLEIAHPRSR